MARSSRPSFALAAVLASSLAAGCGGGDGGSDSKGSTVSGGADSSTKTLELGQPATVTSEDFDTKARTMAEVTVTSIKKQSPGALTDIELEPSQQSSTPYFVRSRTKNVGSEPIKSDNSIDALSAVDNRGESQSPLIILPSFGSGDFKPCDYDQPKRLKSGKIYRRCQVFLIPKGAALAGVEASTLGAKKFRWKP